MSCCDTPAKAATIDGDCSSCGSRGVRVEVITAKALMTASALRRGIPLAPRFCASETCPVVYFDDGSERRVEESELTVPVYAKHAQESGMTVCYCFAYTVEDAKSGGISQLVRAEVEAGHCACEVKNPRGVCCLGDIVRIERRSEVRSDGNAKTG